MLKKILMVSYFSLFTLPVLAGQLRTDPTDVISVYSIGFPPSSANPTYEKTYKKAWGKVKLDSKTIETMKFVLSNTAYYKESSDVFRVAHLKIVNDEVQSVLFVSDGGASIGIEIAKGSDISRFCYASLGGNGWMNAGCNKEPL